MCIIIVVVECWLVAVGSVDPCRLVELIPPVQLTQRLVQLPDQRNINKAQMFGSTRPSVGDNNTPNNKQMQEMQCDLNISMASLSVKSTDSNATIPDKKKQRRGGKRGRPQTAVAIVRSGATLGDFINLKELPQSTPPLTTVRRPTPLDETASVTTDDIVLPPATAHAIERGNMRGINLDMKSAKSTYKRGRRMPTANAWGEVTLKIYPPDDQPHGHVLFIKDGKITSQALRIRGGRNRRR